MILKHYADSAKELSIKEVARSLSLDKDTASKYIAILAAEGKLEPTRRVGNTKFFRSKQTHHRLIKNIDSALDLLIADSESLKLTLRETEKLKEAKKILKAKSDRIAGED